MTIVVYKMTSITTSLARFRLPSLWGYLHFSLRVLESSSSEENLMLFVTV
jgi:hypothetical protein